MSKKIPLLALTLLVLSVFQFISQAQETQSLVEQLGYDKDARLLIINADDFGMCHSANMGTFGAFERGGITSATVMTVCPWFLETVRWLSENPQYDVGVHTVLTSEWGVYKWGPILGPVVSSLITKEGYFPRGLQELYLQAKPEEVEKELRAQIQRALDAGIDVTHIDAHMGAAQLHPDLLQVYVKLGKEFALPCRMPSREVLQEKFQMGQLLDLFAENGVLCPDELYFGGSAKSTDQTEQWWKNIISNLKPGTVTELYIHCADDSPEMKACTGSQPTRYAETEFFSQPETIQWIKDQGITVISYRPLRDLQRGKK